MRTLIDLLNRQNKGKGLLNIKNNAQWADTEHNVALMPRFKNYTTTQHSVKLVAEHILFMTRHDKGSGRVKNGICLA